MRHDHCIKRRVVPFRKKAMKSHVRRHCRSFSHLSLQCCTWLWSLFICTMTEAAEEKNEHALTRCVPATSAPLCACMCVVWGPTKRNRNLCLFLCSNLCTFLSLRFHLLHFTFYIVVDGTSQCAPIYMMREMWVKLPLHLSIFLWLCAHISCTNPIPRLCSLSITIRWF